jgi:hypothetical protein
MSAHVVTMASRRYAEFMVWMMEAAAGAQGLFRSITSVDWYGAKEDKTAAMGVLGAAFSREHCPSGWRRLSGCLAVCLPAFGSKAMHARCLDCKALSDTGAYPEAAGPRPADMRLS